MIRRWSSLYFMEWFVCSPWSPRKAPPDRSFQYTASGFLDSLVFNDEVDAYETWVCSDTNAYSDMLNI